MADTGFRPPKQWQLTKTETITSFANWQSNLVYHLSLNNDFSGFLQAEWQKKSVVNHGFVADGEEVADIRNRKTAVQKSILLDHMLGIIAQFAPSLLRNDITKNATSLDWIWKRIRKYYAFSRSEANFLKLFLIQRKEGERFETLYQRILAHLEDNLLTTTCGLTHDGAAPPANEDMSPTTERLAVYIWLQLIDIRLPSHISRIYAHELQSMTLKDLQPRFSENMDAILQDIQTQEDVQIQYASSQRKPRQSIRRNPNVSKQSKTCVLCKAAGRPHQGHDVGTCWFTSKFEKMELAKALQVNVEDAEDERYDTIDSDPLHHVDANQVSVAAHTTCSVNKVQCSTSPYFYAFYFHTPCHIVIDTGATSSMISRVFLVRARIKVTATRHGARGADKSPISVTGEVHFTIQFGDVVMPITGLVMDNLDCDILAGVPFCEENRIDVHLHKREISIDSVRIPYGARPQKQAEIYSAESLILSSSEKNVLMPGDYMEYEHKSLSNYEGEVAIEPHADSPSNWPQPSISRVIDGRLRIPNDSDAPIKLSKSQHFALIRRVAAPEDKPSYEESISITRLASDKNLDNHALISINPDKSMITPDDESSFQQLHKEYADVFLPVTSPYNDRSGRIRAHLTMGPVPPPPRKGQLPLYNQEKFDVLQNEADKLEEIGVIGRPEVLGVNVKHVSPSFLVNKPETGTYRFVTAFTELAQYIRLPPTASRSCNDVLRQLSSFKYIIKCDLKSAFYQIQVSKESMPYLGTVTPFKGLRVYRRAAMGMPGCSEALSELVARVFGDFIQLGFFIHIHDDIHIAANDVPTELYDNWAKVLQRCRENNIKISPIKTIVCPRQLITLGWVWCAGTLSASSHKIAPLAACEPPKTCTKMRSFLGAFKALSQCIPKYASLVSPLEDSTKGLNGSQMITWTPELQKVFDKVQCALKMPHTLTVPRPTDQLVLTVDASPVNNGISGTLFVVRNGKRSVAKYFSAKLKEHQIGWLPCEHEALAISSSVNYFAPYIRESSHTTQVLTDNRPCCLAYQKLCQGKFSASARVSTFLATLSSHRVTVTHLKGELNTSSDFSSRNPQHCSEDNCQICNFVNDSASSVVFSVSVSDVLAGIEKMPYTNAVAWKSAQHDCPVLRRAHAHLSQGTRPAKKKRNIKDLKRYLQIVTIDSNGLLVVKKDDPLVGPKSLIVVPSQLLPGLLTALHIYFNHPTKHQLSKVFGRYYFGLNLDAVATNVLNSCETCNALKKLPKEVILQSSTPSADQPGQLFSADVVRRDRQKILVVRDVHSSFTLGSLMPDETSATLRTHLLNDTALFRLNPAEVRVDNAPGFVGLQNDPILKQHGVSLDFGRVKNKNKTAVVDKAIQEFEQELLKAAPGIKQITPTDLLSILATLNQRIRFSGLSAREVLLQREQNTGQQLSFSDKSLTTQRHYNREQNHLPSAMAKAKGAKSASKSNVSIGELVYIKSEGDKFNPRPMYIVSGLQNDHASLQKFVGSQLSSRQYVVPLMQIFPITSSKCKNVADSVMPNELGSDTDSELEMGWLPQYSASNDDRQSSDGIVSSDSESDNMDDHSSLGEDAAVPINNEQPRVLRPLRNRRPPHWHNDFDMSQD